MAPAAEVRVLVVYSPAARTIREWPVALARGATVLQALLASGLPSEFPQLDFRSAPVGVWGRKATLNRVLRDQDRVEVYRPLKVDPKVARRERYRRQGGRGTGPFAPKKTGSPPAY
jgi:hypothetical protein